MIEKYSADALRFTLLSMASPGRDVKLSEDRVKGYRNFLNKLWNANNFLKVNKCVFSKTSKTPKISININKWIYGELIETKNIVEKNIKDYRFDEAARNVYQFVWHSYCDWYIEFLKPIFDSKNDKNLKESRNVSSYIQSSILILLHPFIPFFTEKVWLDFNFDQYFKSSLMFKDWNLSTKPSSSFNKSYKKIDWLILLVSSIRSSKVDLDVPPGSFIDISINELSKNRRAIIEDNLSVFKRLGRVSNIYYSKINKKGIKNIIGRESITLYFDQNLDLVRQKQKISTKVKNLDQKVVVITNKLKNKSFLQNAPKQIIKKDKKALIDYKFALKKLNSILNSIKN